MSEFARAVSPCLCQDRTVPVSVTPPGQPSGRTGASVWRLFTVTRIRWSLFYCSAPDLNTLNSANSNCLSSYIVLNLSDVYLYLSHLASNLFTFSECELADFVTGSSTENIPFVFLPLTGQLVYPRYHFPCCGSVAVLQIQYVFTGLFWAVAGLEQTPCNSSSAQP